MNGWIMVDLATLLASFLWVGVSLTVRFFLQNLLLFMRSSWWRLTATETVQPTAAWCLWRRAGTAQQVGASVRPLTPCLKQVEPV